MEATDALGQVSYVFAKYAGLTWCFFVNVVQSVKAYLLRKSGDDECSFVTNYFMNCLMNDFAKGLL